MAVDPNIKKKADDIRNKIYGKEVRESLASGLEEMSTDVVDTVSRQGNVEGQFQDVIENTTDKDVISAPEIIDARNGEANLKTRIDKDHQEVTAQLANNKWFLNIDEFINRSDDDHSSYFLEAFNELKSLGGGVLYLPNGQYNLKDTIYLPSNVTLLGESIGETILMADSTQNYPTIIPIEYSDSLNLGRYKSMITTESAGTVNDVKTTNVSIKNVTVDWNKGSGGGFSIAPILIDSAENVTIENVEIKRAYPSDAVGRDPRLSGCNILFSFTDNAWCERVILHGAEYESLSVRYLSNNIHFNNGVIYGDLPTNILNQVHLFQVARPTYCADSLLSKFGKERAGSLYVTNTKGIVINPTSHFGTAHASKGFYVDNCEFYGKKSGDMFFGLKSFSNTDDTRFTNNIIDVDVSDDIVFNALALDDASEGSGGNTGFEISGNNVYLRLPNDYNPTDDDLSKRSLMGGNVASSNFNGTIADNKLVVTNYPNRRIVGFAITGNRVRFSGNIMRFVNSTETITGEGVIAIQINALVDSVISENIQGGDKVATGIRFAPDSDIQRSIIKNNVFGQVVNTTINESNYPNIILSDNYPTQ